MRLYRRRKRSGEWVWWASWTEDGVTIRRSTRCSTKAAAELVGVRWERERADPVYAAANDATFGQEAGLFLSACASAVMRGKMAAPTLGMYEQKAGTLVRIIGASTRLGSFDGETFARYLEARRADFAKNTATDERPEGKTITESTLYKEWVTFRGILKQAWRAQRFGRDPAALKPAHFGPEYKPRETALTWDQCHRLMMALPDARVGPVAFALSTGARRAEVFAAQAGDISEHGDSVRLRGTKTEAAARTIPVPSVMQTRLVMAEPPFAPWPNARRDLAKACAAAGVPTVTWNDLRRTFASLLVQGGVAPHLVAKLLGHMTTAMVDKVYGRQTADTLADLIEAQLKPREPRVNQTKAVRGSSKRTRRTKKP